MGFRKDMNVSENVEKGHRYFPDQTALICENCLLSYKQLDELANQVSKGLRQLGIKPGDRVALFLPNIPEWIISYLGILKMGAVVVSIDAKLKRNEVKCLLNECTAKALIATTELQEQVPDEELPALEHILIVGDEVNIQESLTQLISGVSAQADAVIMSADAPAAILFTSGTTGTPKGVTLSHANLIAEAYTSSTYRPIRGSDRLLLYLPLSHCFAQCVILNGCFAAGATLVLQRRFDPERILKAIATHNITIFFGAPTVYCQLLELNPPQNEMVGIRYFSGGAPIPIEVVQEWQQRYGRVIYSEYGSTETLTIASSNNGSLFKPGSVGTPVKNVETKIISLEGEELEPGEVGEIVVRSPMVMLGYWNRSVQTAQVLQDGWYHTTDLGCRDEDGYIYLTGRLKETINVDGLKVYPAEVEKVIAQYPGVVESAVYAVPDPTTGESVRVQIVLRSGYTTSTEEMTAFCLEKMASYKVPREIEFVESLPKNSMGKVLKRLLPEQESSSQSKISNRSTERSRSPKSQMV